MTKDLADIITNEYSDKFDELRRNAIAMSFYKYGSSRTNFATGNIDAIGCLEKCLEKFKETKNLDYLIDVANYAMFRYMYPQEGEFFERTSSDESAGIVGISEKELEQIKEDDRWG